MGSEDHDDPMLENDTALAAMAEALAKSADYRILRRLVPRKASPSSVGEPTKIGILLDVETTGLDQQNDEIIELGMVKFDYLPDGRVAGVRDVFSSFNEPSDDGRPRLGMVLTGRVSGHPRLADGGFIRTSELIWLDRNRNWARSWNRLYRLSALVCNEAGSGESAA